MRRLDKALAAWGAAGGLFGALLGHWAVVGAHKFNPLASMYLKGPHGAPFFSLFMNAAVYYALLGAAIYSGRRRLVGAGLGFAAAFSGALAMAACTRVFTWGENPGDGETLAWFYLVLGLYTLSCALALLVLGWKSQIGEKPAKAALGALAGSIAGYAIGWTLNWVLPGLYPGYPPGVMPHLGALSDGMISGAAIAGGISIFACQGGKKNAKTA